MTVDIATNVKITLTPDEVCDIIKTYLLRVQGYDVPINCIEFNLIEDYSDPDADKYGSNTVFGGVICKFKKE